MRLFECKHDFTITDRSNTLHLNGVGKPRMLCICTCKKCGNKQQQWIEVSESYLDYKNMNILEWNPKYETTVDQSRNNLSEMVSEKSWEEFVDSKLLWWINMILHTFGWAIVTEKEHDKINRVYPARVKFRGFDNKINSDGYEGISKYMLENAEDIHNESKIE